MVEFEFGVECGKCGSALDAEFDRDKDLVVDPCEACVGEAKDEAYEKGHEVGLEKGKEEGYDKGYKEAVEIEAKAGD